MNHIRLWIRRILLFTLCVSLTLCGLCVKASAEAAPAVPGGVSVQPYQYRSLQVAWSPVDGADAYRIYQYNAAQKAYLPLGETDGTNYIVYEKVPGVSYYFRVTALRHDGTEIKESAQSAAVHAMVGGDVLNAVTAAAPVPMFTVIDDDTRDPYSVKLFHDVCQSSGVKGCYAVVTGNFTGTGTDGYPTMLDQLRAYEADGFDMLLHCRNHDSRFLLKNRTDGWNGHTGAETAALAAASLQNGSEDMTAAGLGHPTYWIAPMGVHDADIRAAAQNAGMENLVSVANKAYVTKNPKKNSWNRWYIPRVELYGTDGAYDAAKKNYQTGRHNSDRIWNTASDVMAQIDSAAANNAWVIICTHVYESEWYLPRVTLTKSGSAYTAKAYGAGLTAVWSNGAAAVPLTDDSYTFIFDKRNGVTDWYFEEGGDPQDLADYGVTVTGTPVYQSTDPAATTPDRSAFFAKRFTDIIDYARAKGLTNVTFSEGYAHWKAIYDAAEQADACHSLSFVNGIPAACAAAGRRAHYRCAVCGDCFADESAHTLLSDKDLIVPAAHADADLDGQCDGCGKNMLGAPADLTAVPAANAVKLTWIAVPGANLYSVYRYNSTRKAYVWIGESKTAAYTNQGLYAGTTYYYKVRAVRTDPSGNLYGPLCSGVYATPTLRAPADLTAVPAANAVKLTWTAVPGANLYSVYRYNSTRKAYVWIGESKTAAYTNQGLYAGTTYYYKVRAVRTDPSGNMYGPLCSAAYATPTLSAPTGLQATAGEKNVTLTWTAVPGANLYSVYRYNSTKKAYVWIAGSKTASYTNQGLYAGTTYYYKVRAVRTDPAGNMYGPLCSAQNATVY